MKPHAMHTRPILLRLFAPLLASLLGLALLPAGAQALPGSPDAMMSTIPGTDMTKDEFRARAYAQLAAVALNAHAYFLLENDFPPGYYDLYNSSAWNIDISNIFTGRTVDAIDFVPGAKDMTTAPVLGLPVFDTPQAGDGDPPPDIVGMFNNGQLGTGAKLDINQLSEAAGGQGPQTDARRVNPDAIFPKDPGSVYYYTKGGLLQLVMFAPDGTYCEFVNEVPNRSWLDTLTINTKGGRSFPDDMFATEVLYYAERVLPRHYNMVRFMSDLEPLTEPDLKRSGAAERVRLAAELGITLYNPYRKRAVKVVKEPTPGEFLESGQALPLTMVIKNGEAATLASLSRGPQDQPGAGGRPPQGKPQQPQKPGKPKPTPPMGGRG